jgi:large subunit ribosomal protein L12
MENIYAALLLHKAGKEVNEESLKAVVTAAGVQADDSQIKSLVTSLKGVDIEKELEGASLAVAAGGAPEGVPSDEGKAKTEEKKPKEEKKEAAAEGLSALFG